MNSNKLLVAILALVLVGGMTLPAYAGSIQTPISEHHFVWTDPISQGQIEVWELVFLGCSDGHEWEHEWQYQVHNISYEPSMGTNGLSGFQLVFNQAIPELHNQMSPAVGGPWMQNAFSGQFPPFGAEWDVTNEEGIGILPGQTGTFKFCTDEREDIIVNDPPQNTEGSGPNGWAHSWEQNSQVNLFNGPNSIPGDLIDKVVGGEFLPIDTTALLVAGAQTNAVWMLSALAVIGSVAFGALYISSKKSENS